MEKEINIFKSQFDLMVMGWDSVILKISSTLVNRADADLVVGDVVVMHERDWTVKKNPSGYGENLTDFVRTGNSVKAEVVGIVAASGGMACGWGLVRFGSIVFNYNENKKG